MSTVVVPPWDEDPWPSLGGPICDLIEDRAVFGPGSLKGKPADLDHEKRAAIWKAYEVYPQGHELSGRRRFRRVRLSWRKGTAKTEFGAWLTFAELHPDAEVRFDGWDASGNPVGRPVVDPYIPMLAYTQEQVSELAYGALMVVCQESSDADLFDVSLERIIRLDGRGRADGKAVPLAGSPNARDGARTTFQYYDETHRLIHPLQVEAYETMEANLPKRPLDDPWSLGTTTAGRPGQRSVAERDKDEADLIVRGKVKDPQLFYFHRQASDGHDQKTLEGRIAAVAEATGPMGEFGPGQFRDIALQWERPGADLSYLERTWLNRWTQAAALSFDVQAWLENARTGAEIAEGRGVSVGFDGAKYRDMAGFVLTDMETGLQVPYRMWDPRDYGEEGIPTEEVDAAAGEISHRWEVARSYCDPAMGWDVNVSRWAGRWGEKKWIFWYTDSRNLRNTSLMCRSYAAAIRSGEVFGDGNSEMRDHIGAAHKRDIHAVDEDGTPLWVMSKERPDSPNRIDLAMAGGLSWQARLHAIRTGWDAPKKGLTRVRGRTSAY